ncbi:hypothetical protein [Planosporangium mesophilum]|nr:hypothetical protein [Planosporangium mesophilum]NJC85364.1 hypothetical protein [Planosporangium mesophilum]
MRARNRVLATVAVTATGLAALTTMTATRPSADNPPTGWRFESSLGAQVAVPAYWEVNDSGCGMTARPSVVRGKGLQTLCYTREPATKELAIIREAPEQSSPKQGSPTTIDGVPAQRDEMRLADGRYAGWISVPSRHVTLDVRTRNPQTTDWILHSFRLVDVDHLGCPTRPPNTTGPPPRAGFVPADPARISVCYYAGTDRLQASAEITGDEAHRLVGMINAAPPGRNPDRPARSCDARTDRPDPDAMLRVTTTTVRIRFSSCTRRGLDNGAATAQVTNDLVRTMMAPVHAGYSLSGDLPG